MNAAIIEKIVKTVLYEGFMLYPYRRSSLKNQHRWNFGVVHPEGVIPCRMTTECLIESNAETAVDIEVRFLQVESSTSECEPVERRVEIPLKVRERSLNVPFAFPPITGTVSVTVTNVEEHGLQLRVEIVNRTARDPGRDLLSLSLVSTHTILTVTNGQFVSLLDPADRFAPAAANCRNVGTWPVLVGTAPNRDCILSSPIILYDYPQVSEESPGDYFDATEIDEMLTLRVLTLSDREKEEIRGGDERSRQILERAESLTPAELLKLHGRTEKIVGGFKRGDRVRLKPKPGADAMDVIFAGRIAIVESVEEDFEDRVHIAVVIEDDPGIDLGLMRQPGHRFFFSPDEMEIAS